MKNTLRTAVMLATGLFALLPASANAQNHIGVNVPFAFRAGDQLLPPGEYRVAVDPQLQHVKLRQLDGRAAIYLRFIPAAAAPGQTAAIVFSQYGTTHFLKAVRVAGVRYEFEKTGLEREVGHVNAPQVLFARAAR